MGVPLSGSVEGSPVLSGFWKPWLPLRVEEAVLHGSDVEDRCDVLVFQPGQSASDTGDLELKFGLAASTADEGPYVLLDDGVRQSVSDTTLPGTGRVALGGESVGLVVQAFTFFPFGSVVLGGLGSCPASMDAVLVGPEYEDRVFKVY